MYDLASAKTRLGITGTTQDAALTSALNASLAMIEQYCDRRFLLQRDTVAFYDARNRALILSRYPIVSVNSITSKHTTTAVDPTTYHVHHWNGMIYFHGQPFFDEIQIDYVGGYNPLPADLELALWLMFDAIWPSFSGGGAAAGGGAIKAIRSNGASIEYDTSSGSASGLSSAGTTGIPVGVTAILHPYRRVTA